MLRRKGINVEEASTENFIKEFTKWYKEVTGARDSLCVGFVKALVARQVNLRAPASRKVVAFRQILRSKSPKAYEFLRANGFGYASRSLKRIARASRRESDLIFRIEDNDIHSSASKYVSNVQKEKNGIQYRYGCDKSG